LNPGAGVIARLASVPGRVLRKGPEGSPFVGERRLTQFYHTAEEAQVAALNLIEAMGGEWRL
jgi:hypothetical protein